MTGGNAESLIGKTISQVFNAHEGSDNAELRAEGVIRPVRLWFSSEAYGWGQLQRFTGHEPSELIGRRVDRVTRKEFSDGDYAGAEAVIEAEGVTVRFVFLASP